MANNKHKLAEPVKVKFKINVINGVIYYEGIFDELEINTMPVGNEDDTKIMADIKVEYKLVTKSLKAKIKG